jgi:hypothetical protein
VAATSTVRLKHGRYKHGTNKFVGDCERVLLQLAEVQTPAVALECFHCPSYSPVCCVQEPT